MQFERILVVCIGNICRSPLAEAWLNYRLGQLGKTDIQVASAGLEAPPGQAADNMIEELLAPYGLSVAAHLSRRINSDLLSRSDLVLVMDAAQKRAIEGEWSFCRGKVYRIGEWSNFDVPDPFRQEREVFEDVFGLITKGVEDWLERLFPRDFAKPVKAS